ncbi:hypothetical protein HWI79_1880 [Cryptosporidium felis]|nr:hypothetical protein HWI79_1880 [Cryptosporidium felis]
MREEPVRGDPNQGICISLEEVPDSNASPNKIRQWKCSCWSVSDDFVLEWNINFPREIMKEKSVRNSLLVSQLGFVKYNEMVYVIVVWSRRYIWVYCHDILSFSEMHSQGLNVSVEPKIFDLEIENDYLEDKIEVIESSISLPVKTEDGEFQFVISDSNLRLHTLRLIVSGEIAQVLTISISSNWWDIATCANNRFEAEDQTPIEEVRETHELGPKESNLSNFVRFLKKKWSGEGNFKMDNQEFWNHQNFPEHSSRFSDPPQRDFPIQKIIQSKLLLSKDCENTLIISFPSSYTKWNVSFICFITAESLGFQDSKKSKTLLLFRHDSFGVVELCWLVNFDPINDLSPVNLIAVPTNENDDLHNTSTDCISMTQIHLPISIGSLHKLGLFFVYKSAKSLKLLQLITSPKVLIDSNEPIEESLLNWTCKPSINSLLLHEIFESTVSETVDTLQGMYNIEQNIQILPENTNTGSAGGSYYIGNSQNCILYSRKQIVRIWISEDGHKLNSKVIMDHSRLQNKIYFATYFQKLLYLLVNYQDIPLKIDLSTPNINLNSSNNNTENDMREKGGSQINEFNQLISKYRNLRKESVRRNGVFSNSESLRALHGEILVESKHPKLGSEASAKQLRYIKQLFSIGEDLDKPLGAPEVPDLQDLISLWGECSILLDLEFWKKIEPHQSWKEFCEGTCFDRVTSNFPNLQKFLFNKLDFANIISNN